MKALFLRDELKLSLEVTPDPVLQKRTDIIVKVTAGSICGSDIHFWRGEVPCIPNFVIGHEFVAQVVEVGEDVKKFKPGDRVAVPAGISCGICPNCKRGNIQACYQGAMFGGGKLLGDLPGAQAEYVRVPLADAGVVHIPDTVSDKAALLVGDVLSTGYFGIVNGSLQPGADVAIFGAGPVGLCAVACATLFAPARIFLIDFEDYRLELGAQLGATNLINASVGKTGKEIKKLTNGQGVDLAVDAVGLPSTMNECITACAIGGVLSIVGVGPQVIEFPIGKLFMKNLSLKTGFVPLLHMQRLMNLIERGKIDTTALITHEIPLSSIIDGYHIFGDRKENCVKTMIVPG
ncbi:MAG: alcohol dehydrogenase catalytic domain-containing protein [Chitinophagales bacterium]